MSMWTIDGFTGVNNMDDPTSIDTMNPTVSYGKITGGSGKVPLVKCINFDIDDTGGLVKRDDNPAIFSKDFDAKLSQKLGPITFSAQANLLRYTKPFSKDFDPKKSTIRYDSPITLVQEIEVGLWVSTSTKIYFHQGRNPTLQGGFKPMAEYDFPAIMGTGEKVHRSKLGMDGDGFVAVFATTKGICVGDSSGNLLNLSENIYSYKPGQRGISYIREENGIVQYQVKMINDINDSFNLQTPIDPITVDIQ